MLTGSPDVADAAEELLSDSEVAFVQKSAPDQIEALLRNLYARAPDLAQDPVRGFVAQVVTELRTPPAGES